MSQSRIATPTVPPPAITSREEMERAVADIAKWQSKEQKLTAAMNLEIERVKRTYTDDLADLKLKIEDRVDEVQEWAESNRGLFVNPKSITTVHGTIGFRSGKLAVNNIDGWSWERIVEKLVEFATLSKKHRDEGTSPDPASFAERIVAYLRFTPELNKQALIADRATFAENELLQIGCEIGRETTFFVKAKIETPEQQLQEAA